MAALPIRGQEVFSLLASKKGKKINSEQLEKLCILHGAKKNDNSQKTMEELAASSILDDQVDITHLIHPTPLTFENMDLIFEISGAEWSPHRSILNNALNDIRQMSNAYLMTMVLELFEKCTEGITSETNSFYDLIIEKTSNIFYVKNMPAYARNVLMGLLTNVHTSSKSADRNGWGGRKSRFEYQGSRSDYNNDNENNFSDDDQEEDIDDEDEMRDEMAHASDPASKLKIQERHRKRQRRHLLQIGKVESRAVPAYRKRKTKEGYIKQTRNHDYEGRDPMDTPTTFRGVGGDPYINVAPGVLHSGTFRWSGVNNQNYGQIVQDRQTHSILEKQGENLHQILTKIITKEILDVMVETNCVQRINMITEYFDYMIRCYLALGVVPVWLNNNENGRGLKPLGPDATFSECERPINYGLVQEKEDRSRLNRSMTRSLKEEEQAVQKLLNIVKEASKYTSAKRTSLKNPNMYIELHKGLNGSGKEAEQRQKIRSEELKNIINVVVGCFEKAINCQPLMKIGEMATDMMITMRTGVHKISTTHSYFSSHNRNNNSDAPVNFNEIGTLNLHFGNRAGTSAIKSEIAKVQSVSGPSYPPVGQFIPLELKSKFAKRAALDLVIDKFCKTNVVVSSEESKDFQEVISTYNKSLLDDVRPVLNDAMAELIGPDGQRSLASGLAGSYKRTRNREDMLRTKLAESNRESELLSSAATTINQVVKEMRSCVLNHERSAAIFAGKMNAFENGTEPQTLLEDMTPLVKAAAGRSTSTLPPGIPPHAAKYVRDLEHLEEIHSKDILNELSSNKSLSKTSSLGMDPIGGRMDGGMGFDIGREPGEVYSNIDGSTNQASGSNSSDARLAGGRNRLDVGGGKNVPFTRPRGLPESTMHDYCDYSSVVTSSKEISLLNARNAYLKQLLKIATHNWHGFERKYATATESILNLMLKNKTQSEVLYKTNEQIILRDKKLQEHERMKDGMVKIFQRLFDVLKKELEKNKVMFDINDKLMTEMGEMVSTDFANCGFCPQSLADPGVLSNSEAGMNNLNQTGVCFLSGTTAAEWETLPRDEIQLRLLTELVNNLGGTLGVGVDSEEAKKKLHLIKCRKANSQLYKRDNMNKVLTQYVVRPIPINPHVRTTSDLEVNNASIKVESYYDIEANDYASEIQQVALKHTPHKSIHGDIVFIDVNPSDEKMEKRVQDKKEAMSMLTQHAIGRQLMYANDTKPIEKKFMGVQHKSKSNITDTVDAELKKQYDVFAKDFFAIDSDRITMTGQYLNNRCFTNNTVYALITPFYCLFGPQEYNDEECRNIALGYNAHATMVNLRKGVDTPWLYAVTTRVNALVGQASEAKITFDTLCSSCNSSIVERDELIEKLDVVANAYKNNCKWPQRTSKTMSSLKTCTHPSELGSNGSQLSHIRSKNDGGTRGVSIMEYTYRNKMKTSQCERYKTLPYYRIPYAVYTNGMYTSDNGCEYYDNSDPDYDDKFEPDKIPTKINSLFSSNNNSSRRKQKYPRYYGGNYIIK